MIKPYFEWQRSFDDPESVPTYASGKDACRALQAFVVGRREWTGAALLLRAVRARPYESVDECSRDVVVPPGLTLTRLGVDGATRALVGTRHQVGGPHDGQRLPVICIETPQGYYDYTALPQEHRVMRSMNSTEAVPKPQDEREEPVGFNEVMGAISTVWDGIDSMHEAQEQDYRRFQLLSTGMLIPNFQLVRAHPQQVQFLPATPLEAH